MTIFFLFRTNKIPLQFLDEAQNFQLFDRSIVDFRSWKPSILETRIGNEWNGIKFERLRDEDVNEKKLIVSK